MDRFREIETFIAVVECQSFVAAAERLRTSKSVVSRIIKQLEDRVDGRLLQRTTRSLSLTDAGQNYYQRCRQIFSDLDDAEKAVKIATNEVTGLLRIFSSHYFSDQMAANIGKFLQDYPDLKLEFYSTDRHVDLIAEGYDLGVVVTSKQSDSSLITRKMATSRMILCASPHYLEARGVPKKSADLKDHSFIHYKNKDFNSLPQSDLQLDIRLTVSNGLRCINGALKGLGLIFMPKMTVQKHLSSGDLIEVLPRHYDETINLYILYPSRKHLSGKVRAMIDILSEHWKDIE